ncbi:hypothetical protein L1987_27466 [Smallanthus sonchifolius]|uniref:Uncharacterized protein n=1 Tax=Smallanthus sonchifolius TaxID=185202 RepID=A0ACB9IDV1_9ASTR|nr:hypothetical protein L1987_27466 [Smallanthus sonchifolius]
MWKRPSPTWALESPPPNIRGAVLTKSDEEVSTPGSKSNKEGHNEGDSVTKLEGVHATGDLSISDQDSMYISKTPTKGGNTELPSFLKATANVSSPTTDATKKRILKSRKLLPMKLWQESMSQSRRKEHVDPDGDGASHITSRSDRLRGSGRERHWCGGRSVWLAELLQRKLGCLEMDSSGNGGK